MRVLSDIAEACHGSCLWWQMSPGFRSGRCEDIAPRRFINPGFSARGFDIGCALDADTSHRAIADATGAERWTPEAVAGVTERLADFVGNALTWRDRSS